MGNAYRPSELFRIFNCPGSVARSAGVPDIESEYAAQGTALHEEFAARLEDGRDSDEPWVQHALDYVRGLVANGHQIIAVEKTLPGLADLPETGGTPDLVLHRVVDDGLVVVDLKFGYQHVDAFNNPQLASYLCLAAENYFDPPPASYTAIVLQRGQERTAEYTESDLWWHRRRIKVAMLGNTIRVGPHCQFCDALTICKDVHDVALAEPEPHGGYATEGELHERLAHLWKRAGVIRKALGGLSAEILSRMEAGRVLPGLKAVVSYGNRRWKHDEYTIIRELTKRRVKQWLNTKLKSPTQIAEEGYEIDDLVERPVTGHRVVLATNPAPKVDFIPLEEKFPDLGENE